MSGQWVIGYDLSLTAPAAVALPLNWKPGAWKWVEASLLRPLAPKQDDLVGQLARYRVIRDWAVAFALRYPPVADNGVWVESYAFSRNNAQASKLMELGGIVRLKLYDTFKQPARTVNTSAARKLLLGKVPRSDQKIAVQRFLFDAGCPRDFEENLCDAMCVVNWGLSEAGGTALVTG